MQRTDEELVVLSTAGDTDSFNQLVVRWERPIFALAYRVIGREEDAKDVCQETFLRAFRALKGFKGQAKFSSWLYRIALNLCRDWVRRERRTPMVTPLDADTEPAPLNGSLETAEGVGGPAGPRTGHHSRDDSPVGGAADHDRPEGIPRAHVPGDCRPAGMFAEHGSRPDSTRASACCGASCSVVVCRARRVSLGCRRPR